MLAHLLMALIPALDVVHEGIHDTGGKVGWCGVGDYLRALTHAKQSGKPVMLYFTADYAAAAKALGDGAFSDDRVMESAWRFVRIIISTASGMPKETGQKPWYEIDSTSLTKQWGITAHPTLVFLDPDGKEVDRWVGARDSQNPETIVQLFKRILAAHGRAPLWCDGLEAALLKGRSEAKPILAFWTDGRADSEQMEAGFGDKELEDLRGKCVWVRLKLRRLSDPEAKRFEVGKAPVLLAIDPGRPEGSPRVIGRFVTGELDKLRAALEADLKERKRGS